MPSIASTLVLIFTLAILLVLQTPHVTSSSNLIKTVCTHTEYDFGPIVCERVLKSEPQIVSATNLFNLSVAIIKAGISRSTKTRRHVENILKNNSRDPDMKKALEYCKSSHESAIGSFNSALNEIKVGEYQTATYDLLLAATDCIQNCKRVVDSKVIKDKIIASGNKFVRVFGFTAFEAVDRI